MPFTTVYLDQVAWRIFRAVEGGGTPEERELQLYRIYAVLCLTKGEAAESSDVHDAWAAWTLLCGRFAHPMLEPFDRLTPEVQALDDPFRQAIREVARELRQGKPEGKSEGKPEGKPEGNEGARGGRNDRARQSSR